MTAVLVTGGAGYIGSHAVKALRHAGFDVTVYDDLSAGHREATLGAPLVVGDIRDGALLRKTMRERRIAAVMHFAALLNIAESIRDPLSFYTTNVAGTLTVLEAMRAESVGAFVFSSTCAVYGEPDEIPIPESHPTRPISAYGETKLVIERALQQCDRAYGLRSISLRYFNASGADPDGELGEDHDPEIHIIPRAIGAVTGGDALQVFGTDYPTPDGTCLRDYIHVTDLAEAHVRALQSLGRRHDSTAYNLGCGRPFSVKEVIDAVGRAAGRAVPWSAGPRRPGDPAALYARSDRARHELTWQPKFERLDDIVGSAWRWHAAHPRGYLSGAGR
jgi:UDP-glucose-4-epimerase GalE